MYPNPANEMLTVEVLNKEFKEAISLSIVDELGRLVYFKNEMPKGVTFSIPVNSFERGSYTLVLTNKSLSVRKKIIIMR